MCMTHLSSRTRRLLQQSKPGVQGTAKVLSMLQSVSKVKEEPMEVLQVGSGDTGEGTIVLDTIAEFCRQVGEKEEGINIVPLGSQDVKHALAHRKGCYWRRVVCEYH